MNEAQEILHQISAKYISLDTYQDSGRVLYRLDPNEDCNEVLFKTFFRRPDSFRFDWITHHPYHKLRHLKTTRVLWSIEGTAKLYTNRDDSIREEEGLNMGIAGATGVSMGSASLIPSLFLPSVSYCKVTEIQDLTLDQEMFQGRRHSVVSGVHPRGFSYALTVSPEMTIVQVKQESSTTLFDSVEIDENIDESVFHFEPPA